MAAEPDISFELARFEWVTHDRLEVEGTWHGVRRRLARATLVVELDGRRRRLRALPEDTGSPESWTAAFAWPGEDLPRLPGAELEVGRGIVVDLPRPRRSKARGAEGPAPSEPIPASTRAEKDASPGREEAERLLDVLSAARAEAEQARSDLEAMRTRADEAEAQVAELPPLRAGRRGRGRAERPPQERPGSRQPARPHRAGGGRGRVAAGAGGGRRDRGHGAPGARG